MNSSIRKIDWPALVEEPRQYLALAADEAVPLAEVREQARAQSYANRENRSALRATDALIADDDSVDNPHVRLSSPGEQENRDTGNAGGETGSDGILRPAVADCLTTLDV